MLRKREKITHVVHFSHSMSDFDAPALLPALLAASAAAADQASRRRASVVRLRARLRHEERWLREADKRSRSASARPGCLAALAHNRESCLLLRTLPSLLLSLVADALPCGRYRRRIVRARA